MSCTILWSSGLDVDAPHVAVHADHRRQAGRQVQVRRLVLDREGQQLGDVHGYGARAEQRLELQSIMSSIDRNLQEVKRRIAGASLAAGRDANKVTLLAVSKTFAADGGARGPCRRPARLRRELRAGGAGQDRGAGRPARRPALAPDRPAAEQQDARGGGALRLGAQRRPAEDRRSAWPRSARPACRRCSCACRSTSAARPARAALRRPRCRRWRRRWPRCRADRVRLRGPDGDPGAGRGPGRPSARRTARCANCWPR